MTGYGASVLNKPDLQLLIVVPNWLGDGIMAMPAVRELRNRLQPEARIRVAARKGQCGLWEMQPDVDEVIVLPPETAKLGVAIQSIRAAHCDVAVILPNSFRAALAPALARIPRRRGTATQSGRTFLINDSVSLSDLDDRHQQWEMARLLLGEPLPETLPPPGLTPPENSRQEAEHHLKNRPGPVLGCIPGAARGPSKQWPGDRFRQVAAAWTAETGGSVCWLGTGEDRELCQTLMGEADLNLAGQTSLKTFTAVLAELDAALVNDSGGMHLAAAVGTPLVAVFGETDPGKTGPLSPTATVLQKSDRKNRSIAADSAQAREALERIQVEEVLQAVLAIAHKNV